MSPIQFGIPYSRPRYFALARRCQAASGPLPFELPRNPAGQPYCHPPSQMLSSQPSTSPKHSRQVQHKLAHQTFGGPVGSELRPGPIIFVHVQCLFPSSGRDHALDMLPGAEHSNTFQHAFSLLQRCCQRETFLDLLFPEPCHPCQPLNLCHAEGQGRRSA